MGKRRGEASAETGRLAPTTNRDCPMYVVGHDNKGIQFNQRKMVRDVLPTTPGDFARLIQPHFAVHQVAEQAFPLPCADGHGIRPRLGRVGGKAVAAIGWVRCEDDTMDGREAGSVPPESRLLTLPASS